MPPLTTPVRAGDHDVRDGVRLLRPNPDIPYRDGAEERLFEIVRDASDVTSDSAEMLEVAEGWAEQYHTHPARANIVRSLDIPADAKVLEVGAGTGPITRYLGEAAGLVDSVEPVFLRARVGRERTRDLANVEVFAGHLEDVPPEPAYDLVVVVGVLEYVGGGEPDLTPYLAFLRECRARLVPGGSLVLAIENKLGVKYLTGTGEDHSGRMFDGIEDYPRGTPARTFAATALLDLVAAADFSPRLYGVFPDYKHTRVVLDTDALHEAAPTLVEDLPSFPSRFAGTATLKLASEKRVWRELARDGVGAHFSNSFLVIASSGEPADLWPKDRLARYFSVNRRSAYAATTTVSRAGDEVRFARTYSDRPGPLIADGVTEWTFAAGRSFVEVFHEADEPQRRELLAAWRDLVHASATGDTVSLDAIPTNVVVALDGDLSLIDLEFHGDATVDQVVERGLFWFARHLAADTPPEAWRPAVTVGDLYRQLAGMLEEKVDDEAVTALLEREAAFQVEVTTNATGPDAARLALEKLREIHDTRLWDMPLGRRLHHDLQDALTKQEWLEERSAKQQQRIGETKADAGRAARRASAAEGRLAAMERSRAHRAAESVRRAVAKVRPKA